MLDLRGKWALVTGASRGIGYQIALALAEQGVNLVVQSRAKDHTQAVVREAAHHNVDVIAVEADLADTSAVRSLARDILSTVNLDLLFNNAGIQPPTQDPYWAVNSEQFLTTYTVNTIAPMVLIENFLPGMIGRGFGRILNTTSGILNQPEQGAYAASKGALNKLTLDLASKFQASSASDVTVNVTDPGWIRTDLGGPAAPNAPESVVPGMIAGAFAPQSLGINGKWISAQDYTGLSLEQAVDTLSQKALGLAVTR